MIFPITFIVHNKKSNMGGGGGGAMGWAHDVNGGGGWGSTQAQP